MTVIEAIVKAHKKGLAIELISKDNNYNSITLSNDWSKGALFIWDYERTTEYHEYTYKKLNGTTKPLMVSRIIVRK